jgi:hypothetical protein
VILTDKQSSQTFSKLKNVLDIWSDSADLVQFFPEQLVSQLSEEQYKQDLFKVTDLVQKLPNESEQTNLMKLLRKIGQQYSSV